MKKYKPADFELRFSQPVRFWGKFTFKKSRFASFYSLKTNNIALFVLFQKTIFSVKTLTKRQILKSKTYWESDSEMKKLQRVRIRKVCAVRKSSFASFYSVKTTCFAFWCFFKKHDFELKNLKRVRFWKKNLQRARYWTINLTKRWYFDWNLHNASLSHTSLHKKNHFLHLFVP